MTFRSAVCSAWYTIDMHQSLAAFDKHISVWISKIPPRLHSFMNLVSFLGLPIVVVVLLTVIAIIGLVQNTVPIAVAAIVCAVGLGCNTIMKYLVRRKRPDTLYVSEMIIKSYSFPSGHAYGAMVLYGLLIVVVCSDALSTLTALISGGLVLLITAIGVSRVYLGAHFPSDVVVGWSLGILTLVLIYFSVLS